MERVCRLARLSRSSYYAAKQRSENPPAMIHRRGPRPAIGDADLLSLIKADLDASHFDGEGHRKVWARLKFGQGLRVSRRRVLRLMREHNLLSPHRQAQGEAQTHDGTICTDKPNEMWGTDATKVFTTQEGYVWVFVAVEHWNGQCMGWHVSKRGDRFAALEPLCQGVLDQFHSVGRGAARGLALRMDHGSQYTSEHFQNQIKAWGIAPSFSFLKQPETNGVAERFIRTAKEQVIYGRTFADAQQLRQAMEDFVALYNAQWRLEKNGYRTPLEMRSLWLAKPAA